MNKKSYKIPAPDSENIFIEAERYEEVGEFKSAYICLLAAATLGNTGAQINLGNCYWNGRGVSKDLAKAEWWFKKAYKSGERVGAFNLALLLKSRRKKRAAIIWFKKAIALDDGSACLGLAKIYIGKNQFKRATDLLQKARTMNPVDLSEEEREEVTSLLIMLGKNFVTH